jgi:hypothetical protein
MMPAAAVIINLPKREPAKRFRAPLRPGKIIRTKLDKESNFRKRKHKKPLTW